MYSVVCAQIGAREHYAVPRAFERSGQLASLVTDVWAPRRFARVSSRIPFIRRFSTRRHGEIPDEKVVSFNCATIASYLAGFPKAGKFGADRIYDGYLRVGEKFGGRLRSLLAERISRKERPSALFAYSTGALEALELLRDVGVPSLIGQIDPGRLVDEVFRDEVDRWPGWMPRRGSIPERYFERLSSEWELASAVVVNSQWSRLALIAQGVPDAKISVVPVAYEPQANVRIVRRRDGPFTVLWLGQVSLLKGIQYLIHSARILESEAIRFVVVGEIAISPKAMRSVPSNMVFLGPVPRDQVSAFYESADLFVFPTLCDGFGVTQLEAMAHGLPVVATPNCGDVVTEGLDGLLIPPRDSEALAAALSSLAADRERVAAMSAAALEKSKRFSVQVLADRLTGVLDGLL